MDCSICNKPIVLVPSAAERAARDISRNPASYYTRLFTSHSSCFLTKREADTREMMRKIRERAEAETVVLKPPEVQYV